jgi:6,7-dimethyl-8-ribityllumazine synthase
MREVVGNFDGSRIRAGIVVARFNEIVTEKLEAGAVDCLKRHGVDGDRVTIVRVAGAFEIAPAARLLLHHDHVDGIVGIGCVIRGDTAHYDYMCEAAIGGLSAIARETGKPVTCAVLTVEDLEQAMHRAGGKAGNKGFEAAQALLESFDIHETPRERRA